MSEVALALTVEDELGEGPLWHYAQQALYWIDIEMGCYHRLDPKTGAHLVVNVGEKVGALGFCQDGGQMLAAEHGFSFFEPADSSLHCIERYDPHGRLDRTIAVPVEFPTTVALGGPDLRDLFITSARVEIPLQDRDRRPLAGNLFLLWDAGVGLPEPVFAASCRAAR